MLSDSEKARIQAEEIYRRAVASILDSKKPKQSSLLTFLNSALGIWFLSTIVIGLLTYLYNNWNEDRKETIVRKERIRQLDLEIESRISQFWVNLEPVFKKVTVGDSTYYRFKFEQYTKDTIFVIWKAFKDAPSQNPHAMNALSQEFNTKNTISLIIELVDLLKEMPAKERKGNENDIDNIRTAAGYIGGHGPIYSVNNPELIELDPQKIWSSFNDKIIIERWNKYFAYTDCLFC